MARQSARWYRGATRVELVWFQFLMTCKPAGQVTAFSVLREGAPRAVRGACAATHILPRTNGFDCRRLRDHWRPRLHAPLVPAARDRRSKTASLMLFDLVNFQIAKSYAEEVDGSPREWVVLTRARRATQLWLQEPDVVGTDTLNGERIHLLRAV